jgi:O-antigen/teichoic acid export membrane protein
MSIFGAMTPRRARQLWYAPVLGTATALMMVRLLALPKILDVTNFARLSVVFLVSSTFVMLACLGLQALLQRDMPILFVQGRERAARILLVQCVLVAYACAAVAMLGAVALPVNVGSPAALLALGLVHGLSQQLFMLASVESRSRGEPLRFAMQSLTRSLLIIAAGLATAFATKSAAGVPVAEAIVSLMIAHRILWQTVADTRPATYGLMQLALRRLPKLDWRAAFVLLLVSLLGFALANADRWAAASLLRLDAFANYAFAGSVLAIGASLQALLNASVYPMLARLYARSGEPACYALCSRLSLAMLAAALLLAVPAYYALSEAVRRWYPAYAMAIALLPPFLLVAAFRVSDFWSSYMMITGYQDKLLKTNVLAGAAGALVWALATRPWDASPQTPQQLALLAAALCVSGYAAVALVSLRCSRAKVRG